jgi:hypothetical protein
VANGTEWAAAHVIPIALAAPHAEVAVALHD